MFTVQNDMFARELREVNRVHIIEEEVWDVLKNIKVVISLEPDQMYPWTL